VLLQHLKRLQLLLLQLQLLLLPWRWLSWLKLLLRPTWLKLPLVLLL
jgi:hypothetical protein